MDIIIPDSWLKDFLKTKASAKQIAKCLSLCGPSVEKVEKKNDDFVYYIEVTTNRVDYASVWGVAREAAAILPRFGIKSKLSLPGMLPLKTAREVAYLKAEVDHSLCPRFTVALIKNVKNTPSGESIQKRLLSCGLRPLNGVVDVSNYVMLETGQPLHTFDWDKIKGARMTLRSARNGEKITTLDSKEHLLEKGDIVIEDGEGRLIDLAGIMGGLNSAVDANTKNVLLFVQTYNPSNIRRTSMRLSQRSQASSLFEKNIDPEGVLPALSRAIKLFEKTGIGKAERRVLDLYPNPYKAGEVEVSLDFLSESLGVPLKKADITSFLSPLGFESRWKGSILKVGVPSFRSNDILGREDLLEEVARIYGYHNLPSNSLKGELPAKEFDNTFLFESRLKDLLRGWGGVEVYTQSLTSRENAGEGALMLKNPLGKESKYLRTSLLPSFKDAVNQNPQEKGPYFLFEISAVYLPRKGDLPLEKQLLGAAFANTPFREAKGVAEALLKSLDIGYSQSSTDARNFTPSKAVEFRSGKKSLGIFGEEELKGFCYFEFDTESLRAAHKNTKTFTPIPKFPAQIENITLILPSRTKVGEVGDFALNQNPLVSNFELKDIYKNSFTFEVRYIHPQKTLTDGEVKEIREKMLEELKRKFGASVKD